MVKHAWILVGLSLVACVALVSCATSVPTGTPQPTNTPTPMPAPTSSPTVPPTQTPVPTLTPTAAPTSTLAPAATPAATQPSTSTQPLTLTVEELVGFWDSPEGCIGFKPDGTWLVGYSPSFIQAGNYDWEGKFRVEGDLLTLSDTVNCDIGVYRLESKSEAKLTLARVKDDCETYWGEPRWHAFASELQRLP